MTDVLFHADDKDIWVEALTRWSRDLSIPFTLHTDPETAPPPDVLITEPAAITDFTPYAEVKLIHSLWAGVEAYLRNPTFPKAPIFCRMVEKDMTASMTAYIVGHVLRRHLCTDRHIAENATATWNQAPIPAPAERSVGVLGLGALGGDAVAKLKTLDFDVAGWSRSQKRIDGAPCYAGPEGLREILARSEILVTILPNTAETRHILNAETLACARRGVQIINPGRGSLIDDEALLAALASGQVGHATLDVFEVEPLPADHPYWRHEKVTVTPHVAAETQTDGAAKLVVEQIGRLQRGEALLHIVDTDAGY